ncbi:hypothetical protein [Thermus caldilimi]|uniref:hypothetical protein n=1 Tax=Thermus caldilimi TaxID=2483360 RepID=UPI00198221EF|nr:hypothetical protein [Thermus caldilimi]
MSWTDLVPPASVWGAWAVQALVALGAVALLAGLLVRLVGGIPVVGPVLAGLIRMLASNYERWLAERVPRLAEQAVLAVEERYLKTCTYPPPAYPCARGPLEKGRPVPFG